MWQVNLMFEGRPVEFFAEEVDFSRFPLLHVSKIRKEARSGIVEVPDTDIYKRLAGFKSLVFPFGHLNYAAEIEEKAKQAVTPIATDRR